MIDYIQLKIVPDSMSEILEALEIIASINQDTGELIGYQEHKYGPLTLRIIIPRNGPPYLKLFGSLHKWYNWHLTGEAQNYNDFTIDQLRFVIRHLNDYFPFNLDSGIIENLEFGLNIQTSFDPGTIIRNNIPMHAEKPHFKLDLFAGSGACKTFNSNTRNIKIYDKGKQYNRPSKILRLENKYRKNRIIAKLGITKLSDTTILDTLDRLYGDLISMVMKTTIVDSPIAPDCLSGPEKDLYLKFTSPAYASIQRTEVSRQTISIRKKEFQRIISRYGLDIIKQEIIAKLEEKYCKCLNVDEFTVFTHPIIYTHYAA